MAEKSKLANTRFNFVAIDPNGERVKGAMRGTSEQNVLNTLLDDNWTPISVKKAFGGQGLSMDVGAIFGGYKMKPEQLAEFARQLHQLMRAGLTVPRAMETIAEQSDPMLADICRDVTNQVSSGVTLADALADHPTAFNEIFCSYIAAGEQGGTLVETTARLARMLEKQASLNRKVNAVTIYPKIVSGVISLLVIGILLFLVPMFAKIYASFGSSLPGPTEGLIKLSSIATPIKVWHLSAASVIPLMHGVPIPNFESPVLILALLALAFRWWVKKTKDDNAIGERLDRIRYKIPLVGPLSKLLSIYRWSSTLAGAIQSGLQPFVALDLSARASGSRWQRNVTPEIQEAVQTGRPIAGVLRAHEDLYPMNVRSMVETGERTGDLTTMLDAVTTTLEEDIDTQVAGLGAKLEVALLMLMGSTVGSLIVVLYLPILQISSAAAKSGGS